MEINVFRISTIRYHASSLMLIFFHISAVTIKQDLVYRKLRPLSDTNFDIRSH